MARIKVLSAILREVTSVRHGCPRKVDRTILMDKVTVSTMMDISVENGDPVPVKPTRFDVTVQNPRTLHGAEAEVQSGPDIPPGTYHSRRPWSVVFSFDDSPEISDESFRRLAQHEGVEINWPGSEHPRVRIICQE